MPDEQVVPPFRYRLPFKTRCGWPARLVGILQRRSNPFVVAIWNPAWKAEELHTYDADGRHKGSFKGDEHPLDLVELTDDEYHDWATSGKPEPPTHAHIVKEESWPVNANPMRLDTTSMGTDLVRGWFALHDGYDNKEHPYPLPSITLYNSRTGDRYTVRFTPMDPIELAFKQGARDGKSSSPT